MFNEKNDICYLVITFYSDKVLLSFDRVLTSYEYTCTKGNYHHVVNAIIAACDLGFYLLSNQDDNKLVYAI